MQFVAHRINTIEELKAVPKECGVEIDARIEFNSIILGHDPGSNGVQINEFLRNFEHSLLIVNVKTEKIEKDIIDILKDENISNYFFLDSSMSSIVQMSEKAKKKFCGRISEFESIESIELSKDLIDWVWVDCFTKFSLTKANFQKIRYVLDKKICLTSPDLVGRPEDITLHAQIIKSLECFPDVICCKLENIEKWKKELLIF
jgi:hypothetical protein